MNLRDLKYFASVAKHRHFGKAADECCITQPTLSAQIKKLEHTLGVELFVRTKRSVTLTDTGEEILACAIKILTEESKIKDIALACQNPLLSPLKIGAFPTLGPYLFPKLIAFLKSTEPGVQLVIMEEKSDVLIEKLLLRELDFAFLALPISCKELDSCFLFADPFLCAVHTSNVLANNMSIDIDKLCTENILLLQDGHCLRNQVINLCNMPQTKEPIDYAASSLETLRQMVIANSGITLIPKIASQKTTDPIKYIPFNSGKIKRDIGLVYRKNPSKNYFIDKFNYFVTKNFIDS